jgi:hypothetical protein
MGRLGGPRLDSAGGSAGSRPYGMDHPANLETLESLLATRSAG